jgi:hypothetical protein
VSRRYVLAIAAVPVLLSLLGIHGEPNLVWWTTHGLEKVRPYDAEPEAASHQVKMFAARNEFEPFQIVFRLEDRDYDAVNVDIDVTDLLGPGDAVIAKSNISVYLERYLDLKVPSSVEGGTGEWPDPLVPRIDRFTHERRNAFPFKLSKGRNQPVWLDVYVPWATPPGSYRGKVLVLVSGRQSLSIPLDLQVWNFDLPSTSSLTTTFAFSGISAVKKHYGRYTNERDVADLTTLYQKAALWNRITLDGSSGLPPSVTVVRDHVSINWDAYDKQIAPFLDGFAFSRNEPLRGAKFTSVTLRTPPLLKSKRHQIQFWRQTAAHFRKKGWFDRLFNYLWDEPARSQFAAMLDLGEMVHDADPALKNLVTAPFHQEWSGVVDIWTPVINCFERKDGKDYCEMTVNRSGYDAELSKAKQLWWYQACSTHGCNIVGRDYFTGWPGYMIDDAPIRNRIMEWMTWKYRIGGELYFNTVEAYSDKKDPWADVHLFGGNGDGTLFYPGRPDVIGGNSNIPIESIRLKLIREGLEDYEYLIQLAKLKGSKAVADTLNNFIRSVYDFDHDPKTLYTIREEIGRQLDERTK